MLFILSLSYDHSYISDSAQITYLQLNIPQKFKLPKPVLCIGGYLQIELLGRVQRQEMDGLFYIWFVLCSFSLLLLEYVVSRCVSL